MLQKTRVPKWDNSIFYKKIKFIGLEAYALDFKGKYEDSSNHQFYCYR